MIAPLLLALALQQPSLDPPGDAMVRLCNQTHVLVGFSIVAPSAGGSPVQKGWFNVEPGACLEGRIGETAGGTAHVHARSGTWTWPGPQEAVSRTRYCVAPGSHETVASRPPCAGSRREADFARVEMARAGRRYTISYTVSCAAFAAEAGLCRESPAARDGFALPVRELEICNVTSAPVPVGLLVPGERRVERWVDIAAQACEIVFRGYPQTSAIEVVTPVDIEDAMPVSTTATLVCAAPHAAEDARVTPRLAGQCGPDRRAFALRSADYGPSTSRFSMTVN